MTMQVAVVGAGIGGLTLALALHARGFEVEIYDRAAALGEAGAGVQLGPNAVKVLDRLGVGSALRAVATFPETIEVRLASSGRLLLTTRLGEDAVRRWGAPYLQLHRSDLQAVLFDAVCARRAATVRLGCEVEAHPAGGMSLFGTDLQAEVIVGADGLRSATAAAMFGPQAPRATGWAAWRAVVPAAAIAGGGVPQGAAVWAGPHAHFVHYPLRSGREINLVAVTRADGPGSEAWTERGDAVHLRRSFEGWPAPVRLLLASVKEVRRWSLYDRAPRPRWSNGRTTLLGDAAHPMTPFLAQGAAMAIEDAWVLAARLADRPDARSALAAYEAERRPRTAKVQAWSRQNARLFHLPDPLARAAFAVGEHTGAAARRLDQIYGWSPG